jgi:hypothetical protein
MRAELTGRKPLGQQTPCDLGVPLMDNNTSSIEITTVGNEVPAASPQKPFYVVDLAANFSTGMWLWLEAASPEEARKLAEEIVTKSCEVRPSRRVWGHYALNTQASGKAFLREKRMRPAIGSKCTRIEVHQVRTIDRAPNPQTANPAEQLN